MRAVVRSWAAFALLFVSGAAPAEEAATTPSPAAASVFTPYAEVMDPSLLPAPPLPAPAAIDESVLPASFEGELVMLDDPTGAGCVECAADCPPVWTVRAGAVILHRSRPDDDVIAESPGGLFEVTAGGDFEFGWDAGVDIYVARQLSDCHGVEFRYFGVDSLASFNNDLTVDFDFRRDIIINLLDVDAAYRSDLDSAEVNMRFDQSQRVTWLAGFRYLQLDESLNYDITVLSFLNNDVRWQTTNDLYGGQMGVDLNLWDLSSPLAITSQLKAGVYGNDASNHFSYDRPILSTIHGGANGSDVAFVGEIDINFELHVSRHFALTAGYQLMWINGVALASDQAAESFAQDDVDLISTAGDLFYQGVLMGGMFTW